MFAALVSNLAELQAITAEEASELVRDDPVTSAREWDYLCRSFVDKLLKKCTDLVGGVSDSYDVYESQKRGTFHSHGLYWVDGAPVYTPDTEEAYLNWMDKYVSCR